MKKTYIIPKVTTYAISMSKSVMYSVSNTTVSGTSGGWAKEDNDWDEEEEW